MAFELCALKICRGAPVIADTLAVDKRNSRVDLSGREQAVAQFKMKMVKHVIFTEARGIGNPHFTQQAGLDRVKSSSAVMIVGSGTESVYELERSIQKLGEIVVRVNMILVLFGSIGKCQNLGTVHECVHGLICVIG